MSFIAKLNLEGEEVNVMHCGFRFTQITDVLVNQPPFPREETSAFGGK